MPAEENQSLVSDSELADALRDSGNTRENQIEAIRRIAGAQPGVTIELLHAFEIALRKEGDVPDSQLVANALTENL